MTRNSQVRAHREELQRVQIGLVGLAAVVLVVTLANLVVDSARRDNSGETVSAGMEIPANSPRTGGSNVASGQRLGGNEPFADLGVMPSTPSESMLPVLPSPVPDLEPDPQLRQRMDQDPDQSQPTQ